MINVHTCEALNYLNSLNSANYRFEICEFKKINYLLKPS